MSKDIHKWTDGRYTLMFDEHTFFVWDNEKDNRMTALNVTKKLNEQQATIQSLKEENEQLRQQLAEKEQEEQLYAQEIVKLNKEVKDNQFLRLGNDY